VSPSTTRGFSLLELTIGTVISLFIASVAMTLLLNVQATQRETQIRNALTRDALYVLDMVGGDLQYAGVGVPYGDDVDGAAGRMRPILRRGFASSFVVIGDLPLPNAELNGLATVAALKGTTATNEIAVTSELSVCPPTANSSDYRCDTALARLVPVPAATAVTCDSSNLTANTCPWGQGKWQADSGGRQHLYVLAPDGSWAHRRVSMTGGAPATGSFNGILSVALDIDFPFTGGGTLEPGLFAAARVGQPLISTIDRVFYSLEGPGGGACNGNRCVLFRRQCWGEILDDDAPGYPGPGDTALTTVSEPAACAAPTDGTRWEVVINNVDAMTVRYFNVGGVELTAPLSVPDLAAVASMEIEFTLSRTVATTTTTLRQTVTRRYFLDNGDAFGDSGRR
jgi:type II secretory pathway pseudopilin PulG